MVEIGRRRGAGLGAIHCRAGLGSVISEFGLALPQEDRRAAAIARDHQVNGEVIVEIAQGDVAVVCSLGRESGLLGLLGEGSVAVIAVEMIYACSKILREAERLFRGNTTEVGKACQEKVEQTVVIGIEKDGRGYDLLRVSRQARLAADVGESAALAALKEFHSFGPDHQEAHLSTIVKIGEGRPQSCLQIPDAGFCGDIRETAGSIIPEKPAAARRVY